KTTRSKNILVGGVEGLLLECQPFSSYSATAATVLHYESSYTELVETLKAERLWNDELERLHYTSLELVLECD
ncbi:MAG: HNH endonuclease, partial [Pseudomonadota bacterium]